jgi:hypothetical protein
MESHYNGNRLDIRISPLPNSRYCSAIITIIPPQYAPAITLEVHQPVPLLGAYETALAFAKEYIDKM